MAESFESVPLLKMDDASHDDSGKDGNGSTETFKQKQFYGDERSKKRLQSTLLNSHDYESEALVMSRRRLLALVSIIVIFFGLSFISKNYLTEQVYKSDSASHTSGEVSSALSPNIIFFLIDDLGFNDIGYQSLDIESASPEMTELSKKGILLTSYYTYSQCTPTRSSLLTGMYSSSIGMQHDCITSCDAFGVPLSYKLLPESLKLNANYVTAMVGKWDIGHYTQNMWPVQRGFDSSLHLLCYGFLDYTQHIGSGGYYDLHDGFAKIEVDDSIFGVGDNYGDTYSTAIFTKRSVAIIEQHALNLRSSTNTDDNDGGSSLLDQSRYPSLLDADSTSNPTVYTTNPALFLYVAWNAVHTTLSVPSGYETTSEYESITKNVDMDYNPTRALLAGALKQVDDGFKTIIDALKSNLLYESSVIIVVSDNGGSVDDGGNNYPLRGGKKTLFEGGIRVPAFIYSPLLSSSVQGGQSYTGLFHVSDWVPTLAFGLQGVSTIGKSFDGVDQWSNLAEGKNTMVRTVLVGSLDYLYQTDTIETTVAADVIQSSSGCILKQKLWNGKTYKFIWNQEFINWLYPSYTPENFINASVYPEASSRGGAYLFELGGDPEERVNLLWDIESNSHLEFVLEDMVYEFCEAYSTMVPALWKQKQSYAKSIFNNNDNFITYWIDAELSDSDYANSDGSPTAPECSQTDVIEYIKNN